MDTRIPELDQQLSAQSSAAVDAKSTHDDESRAQQAALQQLADRISAARSIL